MLKRFAFVVALSLMLAVPAVAYAAEDVTPGDDQPVIITAPENGVIELPTNADLDSAPVIAEDSDDASLETLSASKSQVYALGSGVFGYTGYSPFRQYPCQARNGFYSLEYRYDESSYRSYIYLYFYSLSGRTKSLVSTFDSNVLFYGTEDRLYYFKDKAVRYVSFANASDNAYASLGDVPGARALGVDGSGRIYVACNGDKTDTTGGYGTYIRLYSSTGSLLSQCHKDDSASISQFDGFDNQGHFFYESYYNWIYWGYDHEGVDIEMGKVENDTISLVPVGNSATMGMVTSDLPCLEYVCQSYYHCHQLGAEVLADKYLVTTSVTFSRVQIIDMEKMALVTSFSRGIGPSSGPYEDTSSVGVNAVYAKARGNLLVANDDGYIEERLLSSGEIVHKFKAAHPVFRMMMIGDNLVMLELDDTEIGYLEVVDYSVPATVSVEGSTYMTVGDFQQLDCNMPVRQWQASNDNVTISSDGVVSAWKAGSTVLTAKTIDNRTASLTLTIADKAPISYGAMVGQTGGAKTYTLHYNNYTTWTEPTYSYNYENANGTLTRVEYTGKGGIAVEVYNATGKATSVKTIPMELPLFGGFFAGSTYNFLVEGQANPNESDSVEVMRVIKYDKNWNRLGSTSYQGINTTMPFDAGSCRMTESGGVLFVHTCHEMYADGNGTNHQANMAFAITQSSMAKKSSFTDVMNYEIGYVSHSFNQFVLADDTYLYRIDQGDYSPRGIFVSRMDVNRDLGSYVSYWNVFPFAYDYYNYNRTGASLGGVELSSKNVLIAGNSVSQGNGELDPYEARNIFVTWMNKDFDDKGTVWLTDYAANSQTVVETPQLVKINDEHFLVIWEEHSKYGYEYTTQVAAIDGQGNIAARWTFAGADLSDCQPIFTSKGLVTWYTTNGSVMKRYYIDPYHPHAVVFGDVNASGTVNIVDAQIAYDIAAKRMTSGPSFADMLARSEVTGDGLVRAEDAFTIQRIAILGVS